MHKNKGSKIRACISAVLAVSLLLSYFPVGFHFPSFSHHNATVLADPVPSVQPNTFCLQRTMEDASGNKFTFSATCSSESGIPADAELLVEEITSNQELNQYISDAKVLLSSETLGYAHFFRFKAVKDGTVYPISNDATINIQMTVEDALTDDLQVVLLPSSSENSEAQILESVLANEGSKKLISFEAKEFSVYGLVSTTMTTTVNKTDGETYSVTVSYAENSCIPLDAELVVRELSEEEYLDYLTTAIDAVGEDIHSMTYGKLLDISLVKDGVEYEPIDGASVKVKVELLDALKVEDVKVVHFDEDSEEVEEPATEDDQVVPVENTVAEELNTLTEGNEVSFEAEGFSVFSFLDFGLISRSSSAEITQEDTLSLKNGVLYSNDEIEISGSMPEKGIIEAKRVDVSVSGQDAIVAYDIKIYANENMKQLGVTWQPSEYPLQVRLKSDAISSKTVDVYHMQDVNSEADLVSSSVQVDEHAVIFQAESFSVYVIIEHEGGEVRTPRVEFHFIGNDFTGTENPYTASPYNFVNTNGDYQTTQIVCPGDTLELINNPPNISIDNGDGTTTEKFFYGWYVVDVNSDSTALNQTNHKYAGTISYDWPDKPHSVSFTDELTITDTDGDGVLYVGDEVVWKIGDTQGTGYVDADGNIDVYLAPVYEDFYFVNFRMGSIEDTSGLRDELLTRKLVIFGDSTTASVRIGNIICPSQDSKHQIFVGWADVEDESADPLVRKNFYPTVDSSGNEQNSTGSTDGYYIDVEKTSSSLNYLNLYPVYAQSRWMYFNSGASGNGSTYVSADYRVTVDEDVSGGTIPSDLPADRYVNASFFQGTDGYSSHIPTRAGYAFDGWYVFANMNDNSEITNLTSPEDVTVGYIDESGTKQSTTVNTQAIKVVNADGTLALSDGYKYQITVGGENITLFEVANGKLYFYKAMDDMTFSAKWNEKTTTSYRVVIWKQKVTDDKDALDSEKTYDYETFYTVNNASTSTVPNLSSYERESWTGFTWSRDDAATVGKPASDGSSVYNVYYDRNIRRLTFQINSRGTVYTATTSNTGTQYAWINDQWVQLTNMNGTFALINGEYIPISQLDRTYSRTGYTYTRSTTNSSTPEQYGIVNGSIQRVYWRSNNWRQTNTNTGTVYNGYHYTRSNSSNVTYDGTIYTPSGTAGNGQSGFVANPTATTNMYGKDGDTYFQIDQSGYAYNGVPYTGKLYSYELNGVPYGGTRYTASSSSSYSTVYIIEALYGQSIANKFPISGYNDGSRWEPGSNNQGWDQVLVVVESMPDENITFTRNTSTNSAKTLNYYVQALPGTSGTTQYNQVDYILHSMISAKYGYMTYNEDFLLIPGFTRKESNPSLQPGGQTTSSTTKIDFYYLRNQNSLTYDVNYPIDLSLTYSNGKSNNLTVDNIYYEQPLTAYGSAYDASSKKTHWYYGTSDDDNSADNVLYGPDHYVFEGWYEDASCTVPFNFNSIMPDSNKIVYAKWEPEHIRVLIDPNGGEIDHINHNYTNDDYNGYSNVSTFNRPTDSGYDRSAATYIEVSYNTTLPEYNLERDYVPISDEIAATYSGTLYYYINTQYMETDGSGLPDDCRNAIYVTESEIEEYYDFYRDWTQKNIDEGKIVGTTVLDFNTWKTLYVSKQKYRELSSNESYSFAGWYKVVDGVMDPMPYNFGDPVTEPFTLKAMWRLDGGYAIQYIPEYTMPSDGALVNGELDQWLDPSIPGLLYSDGAPTQIYKAPTGITKNGTLVDDDELIFLGWQQVSVGGTPTNPIYVPVEPGVYYDPADPYTIDASYADLNGIIYFEAAYQYRDDSSRRPEVTNLTLDANAAGTDHGFVNTSDSSDLPAWNYYPGTSSINTTDHLYDGKPTQIQFGDIQTSADIHLYRYATNITQDVAGNPISDSNQYFELSDTNNHHYFLLGFDDEPAEGDYVATYPGDSVISVSKNDNKTIYAVWEPMVYLTVVNDTINSAHGPIHFAMSSSSAEAIYVFNMKTGIYDRVAVTDLSNIVIEQGETLQFAIPMGAEKDFTISGTNTLGPGYLLSATSELSGTQHSSFSDVKNGKPFSISDKFVESADPLGVVVTFTAKRNPHTLLLHDNYTGGSTQEIDFLEEEGTNKVYNSDNGSVEYSYVLPSTSTRVGYEFVGWATDPNATEPEYSVNKPTGAPWTIADLTAFFTESGATDPNIEIKDLYAVWKANAEKSTVYIYKDVPDPGNKAQEFAFTVGFDGEYTYRQSSRDNTGTISSTKGTFYLKHGEYLKIVSTKNTGGNNAKAYVQLTVQKYAADGSTIGNPQTVTWTRSSNGTVNYNKTINFYVNETSLADYAKTTEIAGQYGTQHVLTLGTQNNDVYWDDTDAGGSVIFTNTRKTADVTVKKELESNVTLDASFNFHASYSLTEAGLDPISKDLGNFSVTSGSAGYVLEDIPVGAVVTITEYGTDLNDYTTTVKDSASNVIPVTNSSSGTPVTYKVTCEETLEEDETYTFKNTLKHYPVTFKLVDQDGQTSINGMFSLTSTHGTLGNNLYASSSSTNPPAGVFYTSDKFWVDSYVLTQTVVPDGYIGINESVQLKVTGSGITSSNDNVIVTGDATNGYVILVRNWAMKKVTVKKVLEDPLLSRTRTFTFQYSYTPYTEPGEPEASPVTGTFTITPYANDANGATYELEVPAKAALTITELNTGSYASIGNEYDTASTGTWENTTPASIADADGAVDSSFEIAASNGTTGGVIDDATIAFTNERKTCEVTVMKTAEGDGGTFDFTALLQNGSTPIKAYTLKDYGTASTADDLVTDNNGEATFELSSIRGSVGTITFTVPYGANLTVSEDSASAFGYQTDWKVGTNGKAKSALTTDQLQITEDTTILFTNKEAKLVAPSGISSRNQVYIRLALVGLFLFGFCVVPAIRRKRREDEWEELVTPQK